MQAFADHPIILFDGVCNLCNSTVQFVIRNDKRRQFRFAPLQSAAGRALVPMQGGAIDSIVLVADGKIYTHSTAALHIARRLDGAWSWLYGLMVLPAFLRDAVYRFVARNRYRWFGKRESCWLPSPELRTLFVDETTGIESV